MGSILLVGTATDGPNYLTRWVDDPKNILKIFGNTFIERATITPTQTSKTLLFNTKYIPLDFIGNKANQLYLPNKTSDNVLTFGKLGGTTNTTVDFRYQPYLGDTDLCWMIERYQSYTDGGYAVRVAGQVATATLSSWLFTSRHPGSKYNRVTIVSNGTSLTVSGLEPDYATKTYTGSANSIVEQIKYDLSLGLSPIDIESWTTTVPTAGSATLSGGSDGTLTPDTLYDGLMIADIPLDVSHVYVPLELSKDLVLRLAQIQANLSRPLIWIVPSPTVTTPVLNWCQSMATSVPSRLDTLLVVCGSVEVQKNEVSISRYAAEEVAMSLGTSTFNLTNTKLPVRTFEPLFTKAELDTLNTYGYIGLTRRIFNDVSIYQGTTTTGNTSFFKQFITSICVSRISHYLNQFIGTPQEEGTNSLMTQGITNALTDINYFTIGNVEVSIVNRTIYATVNGTIPNEIITLSFSVST